MGLKIWQVDAFTDKPFSGNPAGVTVLDKPAAEDWMQALAREMNLSETAFLHPSEDGFNLRWFTPKVEVDLCGHATLASAHILWTEGFLPPNAQARFFTKSGLLTAIFKKNKWIEMDFPLTPVSESDPPAGLAEALGLEFKFVGRSRFDYLVEVETEEAVRNMSPDFSRLAQVETRGVIVTARAESADLDFVSRFFAPAVGVDEDPVTGSAHSSLGPYWGGRLGKKEFRAYQASARGGYLGLRLAGDRVLISGRAVTVIRGELA
ncbi:MAG: PhzF family phenazine biosynthesis protein [Pseudomonadota bacterium]